MRTTRSLAVALMMLLSGGVALIPGPASADDFLDKHGLHLTAEVGNNDKDYIRACNVTHRSAAVEAFW